LIPWQALGDLDGRIAEAITSEEHRLQLNEESSRNTRVAKQLLAHLHQDVISYVRSKTAASLLVSQQVGWINEKLTNGVLTRLEHQQLAAALRAHHADLALRHVGFDYPTASCVVRWSRLFSGVSTSALQPIWESASMVTKHEGAVLTEAGTLPGTIFLVIKGDAELHHTVGYGDVVPKVRVPVGRWGVGD
jgi:hypothetical protein